MGKGFILGLVITLVCICLAAYIYFEKGFVDTRASIKPGAEDSWLGTAMDASTARHAPKITNPVPATEANLVEGAKLYRDKCAICHGSPNERDSDLGKSFYPRVPQFFGDEPADMPQHQNYYIIKNGVRFTAMPAWGNLLSDTQIWQVVTLLANAKKLPPAAQAALQKSTEATH